MRKKDRDNSGPRVDLGTLENRLRLIEEIEAIRADYPEEHGQIAAIDAQLERLRAL